MQVRRLLKGRLRTVVGDRWASAGNVYRAGHARRSSATGLRHSPFDASKLRTRNLQPAILIVVFALQALTGCLRAETTPTGDGRGQGTGPAAEVTARVVRAIDGDTIEVELAGRRSRVRYIGLNTPESVDPNRPVECFGKEASARNRTLVEGRVVRLERDISDTDDYGRLLRYVWAENGGREVLVNEVLVREGFARSRTYRPDVARQQQLDAAQRAARDEGRGLWGACPAQR